MSRSVRQLKYAGKLLRAEDGKLYYKGDEVVVVRVEDYQKVIENAIAAGVRSVNKVPTLKPTDWRDLDVVGTTGCKATTEIVKPRQKGVI